MKLFSSCDLAKNMKGDSKITSLFFIRVFVYVYLVLVVSLVPYGIYEVVQKYQFDLEYLEYDIRIDNIESDANKYLSTHFRALEGMAYVTGEACPNVTLWPNCSISMRSFEKVAGPMMDIGGLSVRMAPLVTPAQLEGYEKFAIDTYAEQGYSNWGNMNVGPYVYSKTEANVAFRMTTPCEMGNNSIFAPVLYGGNLTLNHGIEMYDMYSEVRKAHAIDDAITCMETVGHESCSVLSKTRISRNGVPITFSVTPVTSPNNLTAVVGVVVSPIHWAALLTAFDGLSSDGLTFVLESSGDFYTHSIIDGSIVYEGPEDSHEHKFNDRVRSFVFYEGQYSDVKYTFFIYPNSSFGRDGKEITSLIACLISVLVLVISALVVLGYDYVVNRQAREREIVSNTKRLFVRYISHEIRTPLNTVHVGLVVLLTELDNLLNGIGLLDKAVITNWVELVNDIQSSSSNATSVLNDLITYDKIMTKQLQMEFSCVSVWDKIMENVDLFRIQQREKDIKLELETIVLDKGEGDVRKIVNIEEGMSNTLFLHLLVLADDIKIGQVIKNLLSNALKFTPRSGLINIQGKVYMSAYFANIEHSSCLVCI